MAAFVPHWFKDWEPDSETWKQFLSKDEYQIPVKTKGVIIRHCWNIEVMYQIELTGYLYTEEEGQRKEKLFKDYKDLGMRVVNEEGKTDWNGVETILERISTEMLEIQNKALGIGKGMKINAETLEGEIVTIKDVTSFSLVRDVKDQIATRLGRKNPDGIILLHQKEEMEDTKTLGSYGITDGTTINVLPRVRGLMENAKYVWDKAKNETKRLGNFYKDHSFGAMMHMALAKFDRALAMMHMTLATLHMALDSRPLHPGVQNMWKLYKGTAEVATVALNQAKSMLACLGAQNIRQLCKDLMGKTTFILDKAKFIFKSLVDWFPCLLKDSAQVLTEQNLVKIAQGIGKGWKILGLSLGLDRVQLDHITEDHKSTVMKIYTMLTTWLDENGSEATVGTLYQTMSDCKRVRFNWNTITSVLSDVCQRGI